MRLRSTNANGITGVDIYQAAYDVPAGATEVPQVSATASDPTVKVDITQAPAKDGTAIVKFDYKGVVKTYRVAFASQ